MRAVTQLQEQEKRAEFPGAADDKGRKNQCRDQNNDPDAAVDQSPHLQLRPVDQATIQGPIVPEQEIPLQPDQESKAEQQCKAFFQEAGPDGLQRQEQQTENQGEGQGKHEAGEQELDVTIGKLDGVGQVNGPGAENEQSQGKEGDHRPHG